MYRSITIDAKKADLLDPASGISSFNLEELVRKAWQTLPKTNERTVLYENELSIMGNIARDYKNSGHSQKCFAIYCATYVDEQNASTISMEDATEVTISSKPPGENENYLNKGFAAVIKNNIVILSSSHNNRGSFIYFIKGIINKASKIDNTIATINNFNLLNIANIDKLKLIEQQGVSKVDLDINISKVQLLDIEEASVQKKTSISKKIHSIFSSTIEVLLGKDFDASDLETASHSNLSVEINIGKRELNTIRKDVDSFAKNLIDVDDDFSYTIITGANNKIKSKDLILRKTISVKKNNNTFEHSDAWNKMIAFLDDLENNGQIEI